MCYVLEVSRSGYYAWLKRGPSVRAREAVRLKISIQEVHQGPEDRWKSARVTQERELRNLGGVPRWAFR